VARQQHKTGRNHYMINGGKMTDIPDFTDEEIRIAQNSINKRYGREIERQLVDAEIRPDPSTRKLIEVPALFWTERDANFIKVKLDNNKYRSQFFYRGFQQYGTGHQVFDDIRNYAITTLQVQADHEATEKG
jgi:hypothetical protein